MPSVTMTKDLCPIDLKPSGGTFLNSKIYLFRPFQPPAAMLQWRITVIPMDNPPSSHPTRFILLIQAVSTLTVQPMSQERLRLINQETITEICSRESSKVTSRSPARNSRRHSRSSIDVLARQFLWEIGKDFDHGTGHGVGCYLSVHEGPQRIGKTPLPTAPLLPGMVVSNEPGYYEPNDYGIRCENLMVVVALDSGMLGFETLTFAPFDRNLIDLTLMSEPELNWLNEYHQRVFEKIGPQLPENLQPWLQSATAPL